MKKKQKKVKAKRGSGSVNKSKVRKPTKQQVFGKEHAYQLKNSLDYKFIIDNFSVFYQIPEFKESVMRFPFPSSLQEMSSNTALLSPCSFLSEIYWAASICSQHLEELSVFSRLKCSFESAILLGQHDRASIILHEIRENFGYSFWYVQNDLLHIQDTQGIEAQKILAQRYFIDLGRNISGWLVLFMAKRSEGSSINDGLKQDVETFLIPHQENQAFVNYFKSKIINLPYISLQEMPGILFYEATSSLIDLYESLISVCQSIASDPTAPPLICSLICDAFKFLHGNVNDIRHNNILRGLGKEILLADNEITLSRGRIIDLYTSGQYEKCVELANVQLTIEPNDIVLISILARAASRTGGQVEISCGLVPLLVEEIGQIWRSADDAFLAAYSLMTLASKYYNHSWALQLKILVHEMLATPERDLPNSSEREFYIHASFSSPFAALAFPLTCQNYYLDALEASHEAPLTTALVRQVISGDISSKTLVDFRLTKYSGRYLLSKNCPDAAKKLFLKLYHQGSAQTKSESAFYLALCHLDLGEALDAVKVSIDTYLLNRSSVSKVPFEKLSSVLADPRTWGKSIYVPIFFELYSSFFKKDRDTHLRFAFESFQEKNEFSSPTDVITFKSSFDRKLIVEYLTKVCTPRVMRQTLLYNGTKEVEDERIRICRVLSEFDLENASDYLNEVRERVKVQEITAALEIVEQSLVYVDINAITKSLTNKLKDTYAKYGAVSIMREKLNSISDHPPSNISSVNKKLKLTVEKDELDAIFLGMFKEVIIEFLTSDHGLNAFLSTRIRHGKLRNLLRKSVEEEFLVTTRQPTSNIYIKNEFWGVRLSNLDPQVQQNLLDCFDTFSKNFDDKISYILDVLLRVDMAAVDDEDLNNPAWFVYRSTNSEIAAIKAEERPGSSLDDFIERCIEILWQKTDLNLATVKRDLTGKLKDEFLHIFDNFSKSTLDVAFREDIQNLLDAITRARNNTQNKLNTASNWFNRSEVYDRPDYKIDMAANIAMVIINNIRSGLANDDFSNYVNIDAKWDKLIIGRTLDGLVDIFGILFENAIDHCKVEINQLSAVVFLKYENNKLRVSVRNNVCPLSVTADVIASLAAIKGSLGKDVSRQYLQSEGRSGFHKIWKILSGPLYKEAKLNFEYCFPNHFLVEIETIVEV